MEVAYDCPPEFPSERFLTRYATTFDVDGLVALYANKKARDLCNYDGINDTCFDFNDKAGVIRLLRFWQNNFRQRQFMRCVVEVKKTGKIIGSVELSRRMTKDEFEYCCMLKLELLGRYEKADVIEEIIYSLIDYACLAFDCYKMAFKVIPKATERMIAIERLGFDMTSKTVTGIDGKEYGDYYIYTQPEEDRWVCKVPNLSLF